MKHQVLFRLLLVGLLLALVAVPLVGAVAGDHLAVNDAGDFTLFTAAGVQENPAYAIACNDPGSGSGGGCCC